MVYVDLPTFGISGGWENLTKFETKEEAIKWLREEWGEHAVDDEGRVCLVNEGVRDECD